jgi:predicted acetyltransferase
MVSFERIGREGDKILRNLYEHYVHDMSEWLDLQTHADGRFAYDTGPLWAGDYAVYLAKNAGMLAGFAVVASAEKWLGKSAARDMKDFFVLRAHRHKRIADAMARFVWTQFPTEWIVRVVTTNKPAVPFWRRAVGTYMGTAYSEQKVTEKGREWVHLQFDSSRNQGT